MKHCSLSHKVTSVQDQRAQTSKPHEESVFMAYRNISVLTILVWIGRSGMQAKGITGFSM